MEHPLAFEVVRTNSRTTCVAQSAERASLILLILLTEDALILVDNCRVLLSHSFHVSQEASSSSVNWDTITQYSYKADSRFASTIDDALYGGIFGMATLCDLIAAA